jgi:hypothetical protein
MRWTFIMRLTNKNGDGHRIFMDNTRRPLSVAYRYAIADNSGDTPDTTDDGILYIDQDEICKSGLSLNSESVAVKLPLYSITKCDTGVGEKKTPASTAISLHGAFELLRYFNRPLTVTFVEKGRYRDGNKTVETGFVYHITPEKKG